MLLACLDVLIFKWPDAPLVQRMDRRGLLCGASRMGTALRLRLPGRLSVPMCLPFPRQTFGALAEGFGSLAVLIEVVCGEDRSNVALGTFMDRADSGLCFRRGEQRFEGCSECGAAGRLLGVALIFWGCVYAVHLGPSLSNEGELRGIVWVSPAVGLSIGVVELFLRLHSGVLHARRAFGGLLWRRACRDLAAWAHSLPSLGKEPALCHGDSPKLG